MTGRVARVKARKSEQQKYDDQQAAEKWANEIYAKHPIQSFIRVKKQEVRK